ncbi:ABC transporter permease, partial [Devosia sp.]|uniref:ABC transporter permease n=1 Tax=Devosia sp. TaxID=1871048 RepID=UPI003A8D7B50
ARPSRPLQVALATLPFVIVIIAYMMGSAARLADNPSDKLLPGLTAFADAINRMAFVPDTRTGELLMLSDTLASLGRLGASIAIATVIALVTGMVVGMFPYVRAVLAPFIAVVSMVPPLALLPILFIIMGLGETAKIALIVIGITPILMRDLAFTVRDLPHEQMVKAQTLGGSSWQIGMRVVLPQVLPRLLTALKLQLGPAWLFLIAAEAISSDSGLGYRIFLVRRYLSMDVIFTYVAWITLLAVLMNLALDWLRDSAFPWARVSAS